LLKGNGKARIRKLTFAGLLVAAGILLSGVSFPMGPTRCYPFQHTVNVLAGAALGPWWAAGAAFVTSLVRNMTGTGTLFAFPGSIPGALAAGLALRNLSERDF
jgi:energy coupling factor transporter S component ThiW